MSSIRVNWNASFRSLQCSSTHCGPSIPTPFTVCQPVFGGARIAGVGRHHLGAVRVAAGGDVLRHLYEVALDDLRRAGSEVVVVVEPGCVGDERPEVALVLPDCIRVLRDVAVHLGLRGDVHERVVAREEDRMAVARHRDVVLVVEAAHAPDRLALVLLSGRRRRRRRSAARRPRRSWPGTPFLRA